MWLEFIQYPKEKIYEEHSEGRCLDFDGGIWCYIFNKLSGTNGYNKPKFIGWKNPSQ